MSEVQEATQKVEVLGRRRTCWDVRCGLGEATQTQPTSLELSDHNTPPSLPLSAPLFTNAQVRAKLDTKLRLEHLGIITDNYTLKEGDPQPPEFITAQS